MKHQGPWLGCADRWRQAGCGEVDPGHAGARAGAGRASRRGRPAQVAAERPARGRRATHPRWPRSPLRQLPCAFVPWARRRPLRPASLSGGPGLSAAAPRRRTPRPRGPPQPRSVGASRSDRQERLDQGAGGFAGRQRCELQVVLNRRDSSRHHARIATGSSAGIDGSFLVPSTDRLGGCSCCRRGVLRPPASTLERPGRRGPPPWRRPESDSWSDAPARPGRAPRGCRRRLPHPLPRGENAPPLVHLRQHQRPTPRPRSRPPRRARFRVSRLRGAQARGDLGRTCYRLHGRRRAWRARFAALGLDRSA